MAAVSSAITNALGTSSTSKDFPDAEQDSTPRRSSSKKSTKSMSNVSFAGLPPPTESDSQVSNTPAPNVHTHIYSDVHQCSCGDVHSTPSGKRLSAAGASASLRRAEPKDLPSYPTHGVQNLEASASKAALLASQNKTKIEIWQPGALPAAGAAASLAHNVKSPEIWTPDPSAAAGAAAVLAKDYKPADIWRPDSSSANAGKAALLAHNDAVNAPVPGPSRESEEAGRNAMSAASLAHKPSLKKKPVAEPGTPAFDINRVSRVALANAERDVNTAVPPLSQTLQEKNKSDILRAASLSMARKPKPDAPVVTSPASNFFSHLPTTPKQVSEIEASQLNRRNSLAAAHAAHQEPKPVPVVQKRVIPYYPHLEEAAKRAAAERLARLEAEHQNARQGIYAPTAGRVSMGSTSADVQQSRRIKSDVAKLQKAAADVDRQKQMKDSLNLLAAAERNVKMQMEAQDDKIAEDQGKVPRHLQAEWDAKAKAMSAEYEKKRMAELHEHKGKIDLGGGLWYSEAEVERIARGNVQPILDEITEKAAAERARLEQLRLDHEEAERTRKNNAAREAEIKSEKKRARAIEKEEERRKKAELKEEQRQEKLRQKDVQQKAKMGDKLEKDFAAAMASDPVEEELTTISPRPESPEGITPVASPVSPVIAAPVATRDEQVAQKLEKELASEDVPVQKKTWFSSLGRRLSRKDRHEMNEAREGNKIQKEHIGNPTVIDHPDFTTDLNSPSAIVTDEPTHEHDNAIASSSSSGVSTVSLPSVKHVALANTAHDEDPDTLGGSAIQALRSDEREDASELSSVNEPEQERAFESFKSKLTSKKGKEPAVEEDQLVMSATFTPAGKPDEPAYSASAGSSVSSMRSSDSDDEEEEAETPQRSTLTSMLMKPFGFGKKEPTKEEEVVHKETPVTKAVVDEPVVVHEHTAGEDIEKKEEEEEFKEAQDTFEEGTSARKSVEGDGTAGSKFKELW